MKGKVILIMCGLLVLSYFLYEQKGGRKGPKAKDPEKYVSGTITGANGEKIGKATIYLLGTNVKTTSDSDGEYKIEGVVVGDELVITHSDYKKKVEEVKTKIKNDIVLELAGK